jgi:hypothetical protein
MTPPSSTGYVAHRRIRIRVKRREDGFSFPTLLREQRIDFQLGASKRVHAVVTKALLIWVTNGVCRVGTPSVIPSRNNDYCSATVGDL